MLHVDLEPRKRCKRACQRRNWFEVKSDNNNLEYFAPKTTCMCARFTTIQAQIRPCAIGVLSLSSSNYSSPRSSSSSSSSSTTSSTGTQQAWC